ncbi:MAG TPA: acyloxyacyl hydrolase [Ferrovibrio sp.]|jgi:lipid A 3-O-deacylase|uniref:acyloxyacyl hydrolase n=1 Tax=Ferrovibrio sp. TaxID=1917215 RepID=UPI002B4ADADF|nr:acyloxyacyl hydrolase [Ferrovibrio sp.]HLT79020.1 acyloxyacyl hydrolase [Ferrovibrio sp.]
MRRGVSVVALLVAALLVIPSAARADDPAFLALSAGYYDINDNYEAAEARIEYRHDKKFWIFKPFAGVMATTDEAVHGYAGVLVDIYFGRRWVLTPSFAPGLYREGDGKDLGGTIQFRSQLELSYRFDNRSRLGLSINHISNASIYDSNPGTESVALTYAIPLGH